MPIHVMNNAWKLTQLEKRIKQAKDVLSCWRVIGDEDAIITAECRLAALEIRHKELNSGPDQREE